MSIEGVKNTSDLLSAETRICTLVAAEPKVGKSVFAASLDEVSKKYRGGRRILILACEEAEGGGTMSLHDRDISYLIPRDWQHMESLLAQLQTDDEYGGIVLDNATDYVGRIVKPYALKFPSKEENSKYAGTRVHGVLQQTDHIPLAEFTRQHIAKLITLTSDRVKPQYRKDLIVTVLEKERKTREGASQGFHPDLPGSLAAGVSAMFQSVVWLRKDAKVVGAGTPKAQRLDVRTVVSGGDAQRPIMGDRMGLFPLESSLTDADGRPIGLLPLYEQWRARIEQGRAA